MNIEMTINAMGELANEFRNKSKIERYHQYSFIKTFYNELEGYVQEAEQRGKPIANAESYLGELLMRLRCLAHLEECYDDDIGNLLFFHQILEKLKSSACFDVQHGCGDEVEEGLSARPLTGYGSNKMKTEDHRAH